MTVQESNFGAWEGLSGFASEHLIVIALYLVVVALRKKRKYKTTRGYDALFALGIVAGLFNLSPLLGPYASLGTLIGALVCAVFDVFVFPERNTGLLSEDTANVDQGRP